MRFALVTPADLRVADPDVSVGHVASADRERLRAVAGALGGRSPLLRYRPSSESGIEITKAHPGSLPQFITGRSTLLSNLFRDEVALRHARLAAERITAKNLELRTVRGIDAVRLAVGLAAWRVGDDEFVAPVLLRPLAIRRHHSDFELKLHGSFSVNPELVRVAHDHLGVELDGDALAALAYEDGVFKPQPVIDRLRSLVAHVDTFSVKPRLIVSTFAEVGEVMARDMRALDHPLLNALAGHPHDLAAVTQARPASTPSDPDDRAPASDTLLLDADAEQERVLSRITAGQSLAVHTLPGTGGTQTVINAVGALVREGKRVLVVSARRSTLDGIRHRLSRLGLEALAVSPTDLRRDLIRAIGRNEKATQPKVADIDEALVRLRSVLRDYRGALTRVHEDVGVSVLEATRTLTRLAALPEPPSTTARLGIRAVRQLAGDRSAAASTLALAARLGEFRVGPDDSPWYGVTFSSTEDARQAHRMAGKLHRTSVPDLLERGYELISQTRMRPFSTIDELGEYLRLLHGIRDSLDRFAPAVFERPLADMIKAFGSRRDSGMPSAQRRRLKRLSKEYLRPGVHVSDMHAALTRIQSQREQWQQLVDVGTIPELPLGLSDVQVEWQKVEAELTDLDGALGRGTRLASMPVQRLVRTLAGLAADSDVFDNIVERAQLRAELSGLGLEPLLTELSVRHVDEARVGEELEFAWWQSVLEHLLQTDRALLGANTSVVDRLERDFRLVDEAHAAASGPLLAWQLATQWKIGIVDEPAESDALRRALTRGSLTPASFAAIAPTLTRTIAPAWIASPYDVPLIPDAPGFDVVLLADAGAIGLAEAAPAIRRARQVVAFGDPVTQRPTPFSVAVQGAPSAPAEATSVFEQLAEVLPVETLTHSYRAGGEDLAELVNDAFYGGEIVSLPWAGSYLGRGSLSVDYVEGGFGAPDPESGAVESPDAEVQRVVTLVVEHAVNRPNESLMVITASRKHAERVRSAVTAGFAGRSDVADFLSRDTAEPLTVLTLEESVAESRDRVIFSLGFGVTRHGRVLSDFGDLSTPDGERLLTVGMTRARRSMVIVSSIHPTADDGRLEHGAATLMGILGGIDGGSREARREDDADPLTLVLARELRKLGVAVDVDYHGALPLVAQRGGKAVVVESDPESQDASLRESLRLRPHALRRLGWHYVRVHAFDLYSDPAAVAGRIAAVLGVSADTPRVDSDTEPLAF
ncbi:AAA family ATPase [Microbacterium betulae]|uniref:AAA family ATPase n=1 Tax=Microbacterium betulae TaxID=2981139 RepID=A0AA97FJT8_9MICO|nr:AAA family ATPase [Microbacterium sp. AB]WOF24696.1 AAA family ATPase [Microbacterium sp. AB]